MSRSGVRVRSTTVLGCRHRGQVVMASDGQVTYDDTILKANARKVRTLYHEQILAGFAGAAADALTLFERFEEKLERFKGNISRSAVDMAKDWRTDRYLRRLDAQLAVMNHQHLFILSGTGDVIEPDDNVIAIGAGGSYALAAARALVAHSDLSAEEIVREAMMITASICIYTNTSLTVERLDST